VSKVADLSSVQGEPIPLNRRTAPRFTWRDVCDGWTFVSADNLNVVLERMPPGTFEVRHVHDRTRQYYFVLKGRATVDVGGILIELSAGSGIEIAAKTAHQMRNDSTGSIEFLVVSSGPPREDRKDLEA
jgi:mannose-6-phosphate isomerase-like protein (cupin superfamily)